MTGLYFTKLLIYKKMTWSQYSLNTNCIINELKYYKKVP